MNIIAHSFSFLLYGALALVAAPVSLLLWAVGARDEAALAQEEWELANTAREQRSNV